MKEYFIAYSFYNEYKRTLEHGNTILAFYFEINNQEALRKVEKHLEDDLVKSRGIDCKCVVINWKQI
jgi:hypothetical protein